MELVTFKLLMDIGSGLLDMVGKVSSASTARKLRVGEWVHNLGELIGIVADDIENKMYPHMVCAKMRYMVNEFPNMMQGLLDDDKITALQTKLVGASDLEVLFYELDIIEESERKRCINKLREIAGTIMGVGYTLQKDL